MTLFTDWFTFIVAIFFANLIYLILMVNFSSFVVTYSDLFYNSLFTFLFYPLFWVIFNSYRMLLGVRSHD